MMSRTEKCTPRWRAGFTLLELMVVLLILALLATIAAPRITKYLSKAKSQTARIQVDSLSAAVDAFHVDTGRFPSAAEGLKVLVDPPESTPAWDGPYIKRRDSLLDPWGEAYHYTYPGKHSEFDIYTFGSDRREGGDGDAHDIGNW